MEKKMTASFQKELDKLSQLNAKYKHQLNKVTDAIEKKFGKSPYDVDCDYFIDTYCVGSGNMTVDELNKQMNNLINR